MRRDLGRARRAGTCIWGGMKRFIALLLFSMLLASCGGAGPSLPQSHTPEPTATATPQNPEIVGDDWVTYAHDEQRTGVESLDTGLNSSTVNRLSVKWSYKSPGPFVASPIAAGGAVYVADKLGNVTALDAATGSVRWKHYFSGGIAMTPALQDGLLFIATHDASSGSATSIFAALDPATGNVLWQQTLNGGVKSSPVFINGYVYVGLSLGDPPAFCHAGGIYVFNERTGAPGPVWLTDPGTADGGAVWAPLSYDGTRIVFGTGNTCNRWPATADAIIAMTPGGVTQWAIPTGTVWYDDDVGGGTVLSGNNGYVTGKNGLLYALDLQTGAVLWSKGLGAPDELGGIGTPSLKDNVLVVNGGWEHDRSVTDPPGGILDGITTSGTLLWTVETNYPVLSYVARTQDIALGGLDNSLVAFNPQTGKSLWSFAFPATLEAGPVIVSSGVYAADLAGNVYAFSLASTTTAARARNAKYATLRPLQGGQYHPAIPAYCKTRSS